MAEDEKTQKEEPLDIEALATSIAEKAATQIKLPQEMVLAAVEKAIEDRGLDRVARQTFEIDGREPSDEHTKEFMAKAFVTAVVFQGCGITPDGVYAKALSEGTTTAGGYLVPDEYRAKLVEPDPELSELYPYVTRIPVNTDAGNMPSLSTDVSITWGRAENAAITESDPVFGQVSWSVMNMSALTFLSRELVADSNPAIIDVIMRRFSLAIQDERDRKIALGTNSSQPDGLYSASGISAITGTSAELTYMRLVALKFGLARKYHKGARWVMSEGVLGWMMKLHDDQNMPIIKDALISSDVPKILGLPFSTHHRISDGVIIIGQMKNYYWFDRQQMEIESTTTGGDTFANHQVAIKVIERLDGCPALTESFKKSGTFTTPV